MVKYDKMKMKAENQNETEKNLSAKAAKEIVDRMGDNGGLKIWEID